MFIGRGITPFMPKIKGGGAPAFSNAYSLLLDGVDECVNIDAVHTALASTTVGTISLWVKPVDSTPTSSEILVSFGDTDSNSEIPLYITPAGLVRCYVRSGGVFKWDLDTNSAPLTSGVWSHIALVQDGVSPVIYVDGVAVPQAFTIAADKTQWLNNLSTSLDNGRIGCYSIGGAGDALFFNGNVDEVLFINRALTSGEITTLYNGGTPKDETAIANGVSQFRFDGDIMTTATDAIGTNNGTFVNCEQADIELDVP